MCVKACVVRAWGAHSNHAHAACNPWLLPNHLPSLQSLTLPVGGALGRRPKPVCGG